MEFIEGQNHKTLNATFKAVEKNSSHPLSQSSFVCILQLPFLFPFFYRLSPLRKQGFFFLIESALHVLSTSD